MKNHHDESDGADKAFEHYQKQVDNERNEFEKLLPEEYQKKFDLVKKCSAELAAAGILHSLWTKLPDKDMNEQFWHWHNLQTKTDDSTVEDYDQSYTFFNNMLDVTSNMAAYTSRSSAGRVCTHITDMLTGKILFRALGPAAYGMTLIPFTPSKD